MKRCTVVLLYCVRIEIENFKNLAPYRMDIFLFKNIDINIVQRGTIYFLHDEMSTAVKIDVRFFVYS